MAKTVTLVLAGLACCVSLARAADDGVARIRPGGCIPVQTLKGKLIKAKAPLGKPTMTLPAGWKGPSRTVWRLEAGGKAQPLSFTDKRALSDAEGLVGEQVVVTGAWGLHEFDVWHIQADDTKEFVGVLTKVVLCGTDKALPPRTKPSLIPIWTLEMKTGTLILSFAGKDVAAQAEKLAGKRVQVKGTLKGGTLRVTEIAPAVLTKEVTDKESGKKLPVTALHFTGGVPAAVR